VGCFCLDGAASLVIVRVVSYYLICGLNMKLFIFSLCLLMAVAAERLDQGCMAEGMGPLGSWK